jgi:hypothetical protein
MALDHQPLDLAHHPAASARRQALLGGQHLDHDRDQPFVGMASRRLGTPHDPAVHQPPDPLLTPQTPQPEQRPIRDR